MGVLFSTLVSAGVGFLAGAAGLTAAQTAVALVGAEILAETITLSIQGTLTAETFGKTVLQAAWNGLTIRGLSTGNEILNSVLKTAVKRSGGDLLNAGLKRSKQ